MTEMKHDDLIEIVNLRMPEGTFARIRNVLHGGEVRSSFIRYAVLKEIDHREATKMVEGPKRRSTP